MKFCRFNGNRLGVVEGELVYDVTSMFELSCTWPQPQGDIVFNQLETLWPEIQRNYQSCQSVALAAVRLESPVANPGKIVAAPINYRAHIEEANAANDINYGKVYTTLYEYGLFIKASSSLVGPSDRVKLRFPERRSDHEVELAVVIGRTASQVSRETAFDHIFGYGIALDMTVRGPEFPCFRKSVDTYSVLGPWLVTKDEIANPDNLALSIKVNGDVRQQSTTANLLVDVADLIVYASSFCTLYPGDIIMTGTPDGVSQVKPGDSMEAEIEGIGSMTVAIDREWDV